MESQKIDEPALAAPQAAPAVTPEVAAAGAPAPVGMPMIEVAATELPKVELRAEPVAAPLELKIEPTFEPKIESKIESRIEPEIHFAADSLKTEQAAEPRVETRDNPRFKIAPLAAVLAWKAKLPHYAPLAASVTLAVVLGAVAGAAATGAFTQTAPAPVAKAPTVTAGTETRALKEQVVRLSTELATIKATLDNTNRNTASQLGKLSERFDRAEKAQSEPAARLAKIAESLDRLERRTPAAAPAPAQMSTLAPPDVTGSVSVIEKNQPQGPVIEGWKLREFFAGRAVIEDRNGSLYEVGSGSNLPGIGRVESIKRVDGRVIVITSKGIITASLAETRRPPAYGMPYRY
jgi:hypothetical protein